MSDGIVRTQSKIELPAYRRLMFRISYSSPIVWCLHFLAVLMMAFYLIGGTAEWFAIFLTLFVAYLPVAIYRSATGNYKSSKTIHELSTYEFTPDSIIVTGETFNCTVQWRSMYRTRELKGHFLLYTNKQVAMIIPKTAFASETEIAIVRQYMENIDEPV